MRKWLEMHTTLNTNLEVKSSFPTNHLINERNQGKNHVLKSSAIGVELFCQNCKKPNAEALKCSRCQRVYYCNLTCQKADWSFHKIICKAPIQEVSVPKNSFMSKYLFLQNNKIDGQIMPVFSPRDVSFSPDNFFKIGDACAYLMVELSFRAEQLVKKKLSECSFPLGQSILIPNLTFIMSLNSDFSSLRERMLEEGQEALIPYLDGAKNLLISFFNSKPMIQLSTDSDERMRLLRELKKESEKFLYQESASGSKHSAKLFTVTEEELAPFGDNKLKVKINSGDFSCVQFALLKVGDIQAKELIFNNAKINMRDIPLYLKKWNYQPVEQPQKGDLALYFNGGIFVHIGVYMGETKVLSKHGVVNPYCLEHDFFDTPSDYGKQIVFFHKIK